MNQIDFIKISKPIMVELASKVQETVHLAVLSQTEIVYIDKADSTRTLGVISKIGQRAPLYCTALGKVLLANQPKENQINIIHELKLKRFTSNTSPPRKYYWKNWRRFVNECTLLIKENMRKGWSVLQFQFETTWDR
ncbi:MAG: IclR family transcriptional regulator [Thermodesulfobacteriota bacterium]